MKPIEWTGHLPETTEQMTLRDYFAAAALQGLLADSQNCATIDAHASAAYRFADAMLAERKKGGAS